MSASTVTSFTLFSWKDIAVYHGDGVLKVGTDALLLGTWVPKVVDPPATIIDAGCGTGILAIMAGSVFPEAHIVAVDSSEEAVALTNQNVLHNRMHDRITCRQADLLASKNDLKQADLIISNPPYYHDQMLPSREAMLRSKHSHSKPDLWMQTMAISCKVDGNMAIVVPYELAADWIAAGNEKGWYCQRRMNVYACRSDELPKRSLLLFGSTLQQPIVETMVMYEDGRRYTDGYLTWIK